MPPILKMQNFRNCSRILGTLRKYATAAVSESTSKNVTLTFASPSKVFYNANPVKQVDVPTFSGNMGILPNHVPTLAVIKSGVITVFEQDGGPKKYFVSSGSLTVNDDSSVQVLAEEAVSIEELDVKVSQTLLTDAQTSAACAKTEEEKVQAQISVEVAEALVKAASEVTH